MRSFCVKLLFLNLLIIFIGCQKNIQLELSSQNGKLKSNTNSKATEYLSSTSGSRTQVYIGIPNSWTEQASLSNYNLWDYVRKNADGFYTNFIVMWTNKYQTSAPQQNIVDMMNAFTNKSCYFETSLEINLNNSETTDKEYIDMLTNGGFNVNNSSLNYGYDAQRVSTLRTYRNTRPCRTLAGAWDFGGNLNGNTGSNATVRQNILNTDGLDLDGPLGLWYSNYGNMREGTYSAVQYAHSIGKKAAIMLAPYAGGQSGYTATNNFFSTAKDCVLKCEDNNATPDYWNIWAYGEDEGQPVFPESTIVNGQVAPANTMMGVGYWLLKHLYNLPTVQVLDTGSVGNNTTVSYLDSSSYHVTMNTIGDTTTNYTMPIIFSNAEDPQIEISPVILGSISGEVSNWNITFAIGNEDVTSQILQPSGLNCVNNKRIIGGSNLVLKINLKALTQSAQPINITLKTASNLGNLDNNKILNITAKTKYGLIYGARYRIINRYNSKNLEFAGAGTTNGTPAIMYDWNGTQTQQMKLSDLGNGYSRVTPMHAVDKCLEIPGASTANGFQAALYEWNNTAAQKWKINDLGNGYYSIINMNSEKCLEDTNFETSNGAAAGQWDFSGGLNQQWSFLYLGN